MPTDQTRNKTNSRLSRTRKPPGMSLEQWQRELRRNFGRRQDFWFQNTGEHPVFSVFRVTNPASGNSYSVTIRGLHGCGNVCSCPDFMTNRLGTCKHTEFLLAQLESADRTRDQLHLDYSPLYSEIYLRYGSRRDVVFRAGSQCPDQLHDLVVAHFSSTWVLKPESYWEFDTFLSNCSQLEHEVRVTSDALGFVAEVRDVEARRDRIAKSYPNGADTAELNGVLALPLYRYQREGILFAAAAGRCLIGDEMGLGKTVQALGSAEIMAKEFGVERVLVVCPTSLKHQWSREANRFAPERSTAIIGGDRDRRAEQFATQTFYKITNYDTIHRDLDLIARWAPDLVVLDEAQRIKNWDTRVAQSVKKVQSPYAIVLTGTPLENRLEELVSIIQFVDQQRLGPTFRFLHDHQIRDENDRVIGYQNLDNIGKTLNPILIRRTKADVLDELPDRLDKQLIVPMTPQQREMHDDNAMVVSRISAKWHRFGYLSDSDQRRMMICLQNMRMCCVSTYLVDHQTDHGIKVWELMTCLQEALEEPGAKVVVFSQWLKTHELIGCGLEERNIDFVFFNGSVPTQKRKELVQRFDDDPTCRVFLSTDAGGLGLNLQTANIVINMDTPWNPAVLEQRISRLHRLGQTRPVRVINLVAEASIEEGMLTLLEFKKSLFEGVLDGGEKEVFLGGSRLSQFMDQVEQVASAIPAPPQRSEQEGLDAPPLILPDPPDSILVDQSTISRWEPIIQQGIALLQRLHDSNDNKEPDDGLKNRLIGSDPSTGQAFLKLPIPSEETTAALVDSLSRLLSEWDTSGTE